VFITLVISLSHTIVFAFNYQLRYCIKCYDKRFYFFTFIIYCPNLDPVSMNRYTKQQMQQLGCFPLLKLSEIVSCLESLDIKLTEQDLTRPNPTQILQLYEAFTDIFMGVTFGKYGNGSSFRDAKENEEIEELLERSFVEVMDNPELHSESLPLLSFFKSLSGLLDEIGIDGFSLRDLVKPESSTVRKILSGIINFAKFREEKLPAFEALASLSEEKAERYSQVHQKNISLKESIKRAKMKRKEEEPRIIDLKEKNRALERELMELKSRVEFSNEEMSKLTDLKAELTEKQHEICKEYELVEKDCSRLKSRIVKNPEALKNSITEMAENLSQLKSSLASLEKREFDYLERSENLDSAQSQVKNCLDLMTECENCLKTLETSEQRVS
jgi:kinetochore protein Nuf2